LRDREIGPRIICPGLVSNQYPPDTQISLVAWITGMSHQQLSRFSIANTVEVQPRDSCKHHPSAGTTQTLPYLSITDDQELQG
jgi:hypothetical protein